LQRLLAKMRGGPRAEDGGDKKANAGNERAYMQAEARRRGASERGGTVMIFCAICEYHPSGTEDGPCFAPLPYWLNIDRSVIIVSGAGDHKTARKCMCYVKRGERQDAGKEEEY